MSWFRRSPADPSERVLTRRQAAHDTAIMLARINANLLVLCNFEAERLRLERERLELEKQRFEADRARAAADTAARDAMMGTQSESAQTVGRILERALDLLVPREAAPRTESAPALERPPLRPAFPTGLVVRRSRSAE